MKQTEWTPGDLLELSGHFWKTCTLHAGVKLGVFSKIGVDALGAEEVARRVNGSVDGVARLLNALAAMGLLEKRNGRFACNPSARALLSQDSPTYLGHIMMHHHHLMESWARLDRSVSSGRPLRERTSVGNEAWRESFLLGMYNLAMALAPRMVEAVDLSSRRRFLDLGGGPGTYAIHFCLKHPSMTATVFDLPTTRPFAEKTIDRFRLSDRIAFAAGDYHDDEIFGRFDVAWLSHILHAEGPDECLKIIRKAVAALQPGGMLIIHEFILDDAMDGPEFPALFSLNMLLQTESGRAYSERELRDMLMTAGVQGIRRIPIKTPNDSGILVGTV